MNQETITTNSDEETKKVAREFAKELRAPTTVALYGNLGSGKTTFTQGLAEGLGVEQRIISPTFIIVRSYKLSSAKLYHIDLYRIEKENELEGLGLHEILNDINGVVVIEWAEKLTNSLPKKRIDIHFKHIAENEREIKIVWIT